MERKTRTEGKIIEEATRALVVNFVKRNAVFDRENIKFLFTDVR